MWDPRLDTGTIADWARVAEHSPFVLQGGVLVRRVSPRTEPTPSN
jgi:hypothetical protein